MAWSLFYIVIFPGFIFLMLYGLLVEFIDRKLCARFQNRRGPAWYQPLADFIKLSGKEAIVPAEADKNVFKILPVISVAAISTVIFYIPIWGTDSLYAFQGDIIVILYLLTIPTLAHFLGGWHSSSLYSAIGSIRSLTQLFAYEVPLFMSVLGPAMLSGSWNLSEVSHFYGTHPLYALANIPGFVTALIALQGKLERVPFDNPDAETEIVAGPFTEYGGRFLAMFRMSANIEMVIVASLLSAVFIPLFSDSFLLGMLFYGIKTLFIVFLLAAIRSIMARLRIEQMVKYCWQVVTPVALLQILIDVLLKGLLP
jgi:NADH:ubiquinone oxidoreductase subunit 1 (chain H)